MINYSGSMVSYDKFHRETRAQSKVLGAKNFTYKFLIDALSKYNLKNKNILDIGCGAGAIDFYLAKKGARVLGIDVSGKAIEECRKSAEMMGLEKKTFFEVIDFSKKSLNQKFDIIICSEVLEHIKDDRLVVRKIKTSLQRNGVVVVSVPSKNAPLYRWGFATKFDKQVGHLRRYSLDDLLLLFDSNGLTVVKAKKIEGLLRNFLFLNKNAGKTIRFLKSYLSDLITFTDQLLIPLFGESNILIVAKNKI
jgi:SAM-dependent methyltransferase